MTAKKTAVAYYRTSGATNVGGDSESRQAEAVQAYAHAHGVEIVRVFRDQAVSGSDPIDQRPGFADLLEYVAGDGVALILVETANRFARDLIVQITGHELLKDRGLDLVPVDAPDHFTDETPTATMVRQILGAVSEFEKASLVAKLKGARDRKRAATGRCEGRPAVPSETVQLAKKLARRRPKGGKRTLRQIAAELANAGHLQPASGQPYHAASISKMLAA